MAKQPRQQSTTSPCTSHLVPSPISPSFSMRFPLESLKRASWDTLPELRERDLSLSPARDTHFDDALSALSREPSPAHSLLPTYVSYYNNDITHSQYSPVTVPIPPLTPPIPPLTPPIPPLTPPILPLTPPIPHLTPSRSPCMTSPLSPTSTISIPLSRPRRDSSVTAISIPPSVDTLTAPSTPAVALTKDNRHSQFYFTDDLVTFDVEGCLFRVHRCFLEEESVYFRDAIARNSARGQTDHSPIRLWRVSLSSFETLLRYLYFGIHNSTSYTPNDWVELLAVATDLSFPRIRDCAIDKLTSPEANLNAIERIVLAEKYSILQWLTPAYTELCTRDYPLRQSEALALGAKTTAQIAEVRERILLDTINQYHRESLVGTIGNQRKTPKKARDEHRVAEILREVLWSGGLPMPHENPLQWLANILNTKHL